MLKLTQLYNYFHLFRQASGNFFLKLFETLYVKVYLFVSVFINLSIWIFAHYIDSRIDEEMIALHYSVDFGIDYYGSTNKIYILPFLGLFIIIINSLIFNSIDTYRDRRFLSHLLLSSAIIVNVILFVSTIMIYLINF